MIIHVVEPGETIDSIAGSYGISVDRLALENGIRVSDELVVGETLVVLMPEILYTIKDGDTLESIATEHNVSLFEILRNNPYLSDRRFIYPGETIVIKYEGERNETISVNGYAYPFIGMNVLRKTLPFLTYLSVYSYNYYMDGEILDAEDEEIIRTAADYGVAPIMILTAFADNPLDEIELTHFLLGSPSLQDRLISNLIIVLGRKGYYGIDFTVRYIQPEDRSAFIDFIMKLSARLKTEGFRTFITLSFNVFELLVNVDYEDLLVNLLEDYVENINIITYDWGFTRVAPSVIAYDTVRNYLSTITSRISPGKLSLGISTIGYVWKLPYIEGITIGQSISFDSAIELAKEYNVVIKFDEVTKASYFQYYSDSEYIVRFRDARGIDYATLLVPMYNMRGLGIWNIMYFFDQMWMVINSKYNIEKIFPFRGTDRIDVIE